MKIDNKKSRINKIYDIVKNILFYGNLILIELTQCGSKPLPNPNLETKVVQEFKINKLNNFKKIKN